MIKVLFMGRKQVAADILGKLHADKRCDIVGVLTDSHLEVSATQNVAEQLGLPVLRYDDVMERLGTGNLSFDIGLSILYWRKLREPFIDAALHGIINFHPAPLPEFKGVGGYNLAILEALNEWAVSAHYIDKNIDTGRIVDVRTFPIDLNSETAQSLERKSMGQLRALFDTVWAQYSKDPRHLPTTENEGGRYLSRVELEAMKRIDPVVDDIERKIRAFWFPPYDGAYVEFDEAKYTLVTPEILRDLAPEGVSSLFSTPKTASS